MKGIEYRGVTSVDGPIVVLKRTENVFYNETVYVRDRLGEKRVGKVVDISDDEVRDLIQDIRSKKDLLVPECSKCQAPCGRMIFEYGKNSFKNNCCGKRNSGNSERLSWSF